MDIKPNFRPKQKTLRASELKLLAKMIPRVIVGGKGISVKQFGDRIIIENTAINTGKTTAATSTNSTAVFGIIREDTTPSDALVLCDLYAATSTSFGIDPATGTQRTPLKESVSCVKQTGTFQNGELVAVSEVSGSYYMQKIHDSSLRNITDTGQVAVSEKIDGLAFDAAVIMNDYILNSEAKTYLRSTSPGVLCYMSISEKTDLAYWPILDKLSQVSEVLDNVNDWEKNITYGNEGNPSFSYDKTESSSGQTISYSASGNKNSWTATGTNSGGTDYTDDEEYKRIWYPGSGSSSGGMEVTTRLTAGGYTISGFRERMCYHSIYQYQHFGVIDDDSYLAVEWSAMADVYKLKNGTYVFSHSFENIYSESGIRPYSTRKRWIIDLTTQDEWRIGDTYGDVTW
jgi:hypothetical protein